ncbi:hypothetical protein BS78_K197400 [Paspalum vaginatum]|uniref:Glycosyltransferase N-terminal domain-containing protein n=1 Tax=Paspalum vaginatum TaxID=158149 RepID=A0A9W8CFR8_9POAL|nr:hypothetical protein BS78_K197400 [Paspalum vaginatum]
MDSIVTPSATCPHVVLVPFPAQGHVAPLMQLARLLHSRGAHVTFVHTQFNYCRIVRAKGEAAVRPTSTAAPGFRFRVEVIDDGISLSAPPHDVVALVGALQRNCPGTFRALLRRLSQEHGTPPVTCVVGDVVMPFAAAVAREAGIPEAQFFTASACGLMGYLQYDELIKRGLVPLKGLTNRYLDAPLEWVPGMKHMRLRDMPAFCHTTDPDDFMVAASVEHMKGAVGSKAIIINTLYELEKDVVDALAASSSFPPIYTVGSLAEIVAASAPADDACAIDISVWQEDTQCLSWLDGKAGRSVVYVNFGSVVVMTAAQTQEFALGLLRCGYPFLWVKRPDVVDGSVEELALPEAFLDEVTRGGGLVVPWCPQVAVLKHAAVGLFVTHCGWNSLLEATAAGQPVLGWPVIAEQTTNCRQVCECWNNGVALPGEVRSGVVADLVREMMSGDLGKKKRAKAAEWKAVAVAATMKGGSSWRNVERLLDDVLLLVGSNN